ncbi:SH3 domain-containing protein [Alteromonas sp. 345S023]|uniref:N-acetylmuramoyl-L-alanine amidase n=1 Tax=Alteromonas profundi TaxID=2696062 RepID=A0A7X5LJ23_9ALTE|nr:N-acetylmuramoyl-L-alanine amidase [Alteromonas profundi]NDV90277.1 SH3 domain-containing protein [Alteromonas profundi]
MTFQHHHGSSQHLAIADHLLKGEDVSFIPSPNTSGAFPSGLPDTIVIHFTAGSSLSSSVNVMTNADNKVSAHMAIGRSGEMVQMLPFNKIAWHAGKSFWKGRTGLNKYAIGIELDNAGQLTANDEGEYMSWFGGVYKSKNVFKGVHRNQPSPSYWHRYTEAQIMRTFALCQLLCQHYNIHTIVGHEEIAPERKVDPGPAFPLDKLRMRLLGNTTSASDLAMEMGSESTAMTHGNQRSDTAAEDISLQEEQEQGAVQAVVSANKLNVRSGPGTHFAKQGAALYAGEKVTVLSVRDGWANVARTSTGWVSESYLAMVEDAKESK